MRCRAHVQAHTHTSRLRACQLIRCADAISKIRLIRTSIQVGMRCLVSHMGNTINYARETIKRGIFGRHFLGRFSFRLHKVMCALFVSNAMPNTLQMMCWRQLRTIKSNAWWIFVSLHVWVPSCLFFGTIICRCCPQWQTNDSRTRKTGNNDFCEAQAISWWL